MYEEPEFKVGPICWASTMYYAGREVRVTIRKYHSTAYCWVALCDDGFIYSMRDSSVELTFDDAVNAARDCVQWFFENY